MKNSLSLGSVFGNDSKPWQQHSSSATNDAFGDLLSGQQFTSHTPAHKATLMEQRREELEKTMDPVKLKVFFNFSTSIKNSWKTALRLVVEK